MLDNLITAYRARFYEFNLKKISSLSKKERPYLFLNLSILFVLLIVSVTVMLYSRNIVISVSVTIVVMICIRYIDSKMIKRHQTYIPNKKEHLVNVKDFLQHCIPGISLYTREQVNFLIEQLSEKINDKKPYSKIKKYLWDFGKAFVIPGIMFFLGVYITDKLEFSTALYYLVFITILIASIVFLLQLIFSFLRKMIDRDYDATIALRNDLIDIKLLYFCHESDNHFIIR